MGEAYHLHSHLAQRVQRQRPHPVARPRRLHRLEHLPPQLGGVGGHCVEPAVVGRHLVEDVLLRLGVGLAYPVHLVVGCGGVFHITILLVDEVLLGEGDAAVGVQLGQRPHHL